MERWTQGEWQDNETQRAQAQATPEPVATRPADVMPLPTGQFTDSVAFAKPVPEPLAWLIEGAGVNGPYALTATEFTNRSFNTGKFTPLYTHPPEHTTAVPANGWSLAERKAKRDGCASECPSFQWRQYIEHKATIAALTRQLAEVTAQRDALSDLEAKLESLVNRCNNDLVLSNDEAVVSAEAALERVYKSRRM